MMGVFGLALQMGLYRYDGSTITDFKGKQDHKLTCIPDNLN